jgi:hypothetical protein
MLSKAPIEHEESDALIPPVPVQPHPLLRVLAHQVLHHAGDRIVPILFSNSGSGRQALYDHPCRAHCSLRGRGVPSA